MSIDQTRWHALTRLEGFTFSEYPVVTGEDLKAITSFMLVDVPFRDFTPTVLADRVSTIFDAACDVQASDESNFPDVNFYMHVAKKSMSKVHSDVLPQAMEIYVHGLELQAKMSGNCISVDFSVAQAALSVASWIRLTRPRDKGIEIIHRQSKMVTLSLPRKRKAPHDNEKYLEKAIKERDQARLELQEEKARKQFIDPIEHEKTIQERDQAREELQKAKLHFQESMALFIGQYNQVRSAEEALEQKKAELERATTKNGEMAEKLKQQSEFLANAASKSSDATKDLARVQSELGHWKEKVAEFQTVISKCVDGINDLHNPKGEGGSDV